MTISRDERGALADLFLSVGPDAPTLCEGWTARDLAVHLVVREYRPDAAAGMFLSPLHSHLRNVTSTVADRPFEDLVASYRQGPPVWSPMRLVDRFVNLTENFVHHEDVRRGGGEWRARALPRATRDALWRAAGSAARGLIVSSGPTVRLSRTDGARGNGDTVTIGRGTPEVTVTGSAPELTLWVFGRDKACDLTTVGPVSEVRRRKI